MNVRMYSAAREATTRARNVASAIQQVQRQVNDDNKDISGKVDKDEQIRSKRKAELELFTAKNAKELAAKQEKLTQIQAAVAAIQTVVSVTVAVVSGIKELTNKKKKGDKAGEGEGQGGQSVDDPTKTKNGKTVVGGPQKPPTEEEIAKARVTEQGNGKGKTETPKGNGKGNGKGSTVDRAQGLAQDAGNKAGELGAKAKKEAGELATRAGVKVGKDGNRSVDPSNVNNGGGATGNPLVKPSNAKGVGGDPTAVGGKGNPDVTREEKGGSVKTNKGEAGTGAGIEGGLKSAGEKLSKFGDAIGFRGVGGKNNYTQDELKEIAKAGNDPTKQALAAADRGPLSGGAISALAKLIIQLTKILGQNIKQDDGIFSEIAGKAKAIGHALATGKDENGKDLNAIGKFAHGVASPIIKTGKLVIDSAASGLGKIAQAGATAIGTGVALGVGAVAGGAAALIGAPIAGAVSAAKGQGFAKGAKGAFSDYAHGLKGTVDAINGSINRSRGGVEGGQGSSEAGKIGRQVDKTGTLSGDQFQKFKAAVTTDLQNRGVAPEEAAKLGGQAATKLQNDVALANVTKAGGIGNGLSLEAGKDGKLTLTGGGASIEVGRDLASKLASGGADAQQALAVLRQSGGLGEAAGKAGIKDAVLGAGGITGKKGENDVNLGSAQVQQLAAAGAAGLTANVSFDAEGNGSVALKSADGKDVSLSGDQAKQINLAAGAGLKATVGTEGDKTSVSFATGDGTKLTGDQAKQISDLKTAGADIKGISVTDGKLSVQLGENSGGKTLGADELANFGQAVSNAGGDASKVSLDKSGNIGTAINGKDPSQAAIVTAVNNLNKGLDAIYAKSGGTPEGLKIDLTGAKASADGSSITLADGRSISLQSLDGNASAADKGLTITGKDGKSSLDISNSTLKALSGELATDGKNVTRLEKAIAAGLTLTSSSETGVTKASVGFSTDGAGNASLTAVNASGSNSIGLQLTEDIARGQASGKDLKGALKINDTQAGLLGLAAQGVNINGAKAGADGGIELGNGIKLDQNFLKALGEGDTDATNAARGLASAIAVAGPGAELGNISVTADARGRNVEISAGEGSKALKGFDLGSIAAGGAYGNALIENLAAAGQGGGAGKLGEQALGSIVDAANAAGAKVQNADGTTSGLNVGNLTTASTKGYKSQEQRFDQKIADNFNSLGLANVLTLGLAGKDGAIHNIGKSVADLVKSFGTKSTEDLVGNLRSEAASKLAGGITGSDEVKAALRAGDTGKVKSLLQEAGLSAEEANKVVKESRGPNGEKRASISGLEDLLKGRIDVSRTQDSKGNATFSLTLKDGGGTGGDTAKLAASVGGTTNNGVSSLGEFSVGKDGSLTAGKTGLDFSGVKSDINNERKQAIASQFSNIVGNDSNPLAVKADDITLSDKGELVGVKVGGRNLSVDDYAAELQGIGGKGRITGDQLRSFAQGAVASTVGALQNGGKSGISASAQLTLQNLASSGLNLENAKVTFGADGAVNVSVGQTGGRERADGSKTDIQNAVSFSIDKDGKLSGSSSQAPTGQAPTTQALTAAKAQGGEAGALLAQAGIKDAGAKGQQFNQNQDEINKLRTQINENFSKLGGLVGGKVSNLDVTFTDGKISGAAVKLNNGVGFDLSINNASGQYAVSNLASYNEKGEKTGDLDPNEAGFNAKAIGGLLDSLRKNGIAGSVSDRAGSLEKALKADTKLQGFLDQGEAGRQGAITQLQTHGLTAEQAGKLIQNSGGSLAEGIGRKDGSLYISTGRFGDNNDFTLKDAVAEGTQSGANQGGIIGLLKGLGAQDIKVDSRNNLGKNFVDDKNPNNDVFTQETTASFKLGGQNFTVGIGHDANGNASVNLGSLSDAQKGELQKALQAQVNDVIARSSTPGSPENSKLAELFDGGKQPTGGEVVALLGSQLKSKFPGLGEADAKALVQHALGGQDAGSTARNLALLQASTDPKIKDLVNKGGENRQQVQDLLAASLKKYGVVGDNANDIATQLVKANGNTVTGFEALSPTGKLSGDDASRILSRSFGGGNVGVDSIRDASGGIIADENLTDRQRANRDQTANNILVAEGQFIQSAIKSGNGNVAFATLNVRALIGEDVANGLIGSRDRGFGKEGTVGERGEEFRKLISEGKLDQAQGILDEALRASGLQAGSLSVNELITSEGGEQRLKTTAELVNGVNGDAGIGGLKVGIGYDGRTASIEAVGIKGKSIALQQALGSDAFQNGTAEGDKLVAQALLGGRVGQALDDAGNNEALSNALSSGDRGAAVNALKELLGSKGLDGASAEILAQKLISTPDPQTGRLTLKKGAGEVNDAVSGALASGNASLNGRPIKQLTEQLRGAVNGNSERDPYSGQISPSSLAKRDAAIDGVLDGANLRTNLGASVTVNGDGTRTVKASGNAGFQSALREQLPSNEKSGGQKFLDGVSDATKVLAHALEKGMVGLQAFKKAMEELEEIRARKEAAEKQYEAALEYAQKIGVTFGNAGDGGQAADESNAAAAATAANAKGGVPGYESPQLAAMAKQGHKDGDRLQGPDGKDAKQPGSPSQPVQSSLEEQKAQTSEELQKVAGDANFANVAVLLGQNPGQLIQQAQQMNMLQQLTQTIQQLQSPFGNPVQEMQRFVDSLKAKQNQAVTPADGTQGP